LAFQLLQTGKLAAAEEIVRPLLAQGMTDEMLPLVGALRLQQGRFAEAAPLFERARMLNPREVRFAFLHGTALAGFSQFEQAVSAFQAAIKLGPDIADIYLSLGQALRKLGQLEEAQNTYRKLLRSQPTNVDGYVALASALAEAGQFAQAEAPLRRALQYVRDPKAQAAIHNNLAIVLENQNRQAEALENLERTKSLTPDQANLDPRRIDTLFQLGRYDECLELYKKLLDRDPADTEIHRAYNSLLHRLGRKEEILTSYDRAPQTREILLGKAAMLTAQKRGPEAQAVYDSLLARDPMDLAAAAGRANSLMLMGCHAESVAAFETVISQRGDDTALLNSAAGAALLAGDPQKAQHFCQTALSHQPHDQTSLALLGTSWRLQDDTQDESLNGYDSLIRVFDLEPPDGFSSMEDFNAELGAYLARLHPKTDAYLEQSLRGGTQTEGSLFGAGHELVENVRTRIEQAISRYVGDLAADAQHPFLSRRRNRFQYNGAWSSLLRDQGFHINHLHPMGWISSCYYVTVPDETRDAENRHGWIKFGEPGIPGLEASLKNPIRRAVQPFAGRLVLFPSYMWHGTIPFRSASARTTIAFDVVPQ
jgi:tetratricopeptide (TPR) repeat protein